jgi:hypothetical protein
VTGPLGADYQMVQITAPTQTGRAEMVVFGSFPEASGRELSCTGFQFCLVRTDTSYQGPVPVEVVP